MLIGKVGAGKTSVLSTLRSSGGYEKPAPLDRTRTVKCQREDVNIGDKNLVVVDTPGLCNPEKSNKEVLKEIKQGLKHAAPGPHVFLLVLDLAPFTTEEQEMVETIKETFGENVLKYTMVLFTRGDQLEEDQTTLQEFIKGDLKIFVDKCSGGCHVINNRNQSGSEVTELLQKIKDMVQKNEPKHYTAEMVGNIGRKKIVALSVNGSAVVGAGVGGAVSHFAGGTIGIPVGVAVGAAVGGILGGVGIVTAAHIRKKCVMQ